LSGLLITPVNQIQKGSGHPLHHLPLPPLSWDSVNGLFFEKYDFHGYKSFKPVDYRLNESTKLLFTLTCLGGIPQFVTELIKKLAEMHSTKDVSQSDLELFLSKFIFTLHSKSIEYTAKYDKIKGWVPLICYAVTQKSVSKEESIPGFNESVETLQSSGVCLFEEETIYIPYPYLLSAVNLRYSEHGKEEQEILDSLNLIFQNIDSRLFSTTPLWTLWEDFGAYFLSLRMNCWRYLKKMLNENLHISFKELHPGAFHNFSENFTFTLYKTKVINIHEQLFKDLKLVTQKGMEQEKIEWKKVNNFIYLNGTNGKGVDIWTRLSFQNEEHLMVDQRKRSAVTISSDDLKDLVSKAKSVIPNLKHSIGIFSNLSSVDLSDIYSLKSLTNVFIVSRKNVSNYYNLFKFHPLISPAININLEQNQTTIASLFQGGHNTKTFGLLADLIKDEKAKGGRFIDQADLKNRMVKRLEKLFQNPNERKEWYVQTRFQETKSEKAVAEEWWDQLIISPQISFH
jgi:hypothetical protein